MIYWFTGQPGHGKTLCAIARALEFKQQGRRVFVCNVRDFDYEKTGMEKLTPEQFRNWMQELPDGAVCLVDEAYEHGMLPKRSAAQKVPEHVERLATHRHRGLDFIFVCQSPDKQIDGFVHDLIESHTHVRRRFGTSFQHLRQFDRFERNPEKSTPIVIKRQRLPKHVFGLYKSTELDTTERKVPWYFFALAIGAPLALVYMYWTFGGMAERLTGAKAAQPATASHLDANAAKAAVASAPVGGEPMSTLEYLRQFVPRVPSQPWSAPAYDDITISNEPPRIFCMAAESGENAVGEAMAESCTCLTEQGTRYTLQQDHCRYIAKHGQYEPHYTERVDKHDGYGMQERIKEDIARDSSRETLLIGGGQASGYGDFGNDPQPGSAAGGAQ